MDLANGGLGGIQTHDQWRYHPSPSLFCFTLAFDKKRVPAKIRVLWGFGTLFFPAYNIGYTLSILIIRYFIRYSQRC